MVFPQKFGMSCLFLNFVHLALSTATEIIPLTLLGVVRFVEEIAHTNIVDQSQIAVSWCFPQHNPIFQYWIVVFH